MDELKKRSAMSQKTAPIWPRGRRRAVATAGLATLLLVSLALVPRFVPLSAQRDASQTDQVVGGLSPLGSGAGLDQTNKADIPDVPERLIASEAADGVHLQVVTTSDKLDASQREDVTRAVKSAQGSLRSLSKARVRGVSLALATVDNFGPAPDVPDPSATSIDLLIENRLVWVVDFANVATPVRGPLTNFDTKPEFYLSDLVVLVDAKSMEPIIAETVTVKM